MLKILKVLLSVSLLILIAMPAVAETQVNEKKIYAASHNERSHIDINKYELDSADYLIEYWEGVIRVIGTGVVDIYGQTKANKICNEIEVELILQQKSGSSWVTIGPSYIFRGYYNDEAWGSKQIQVERGKEYRLRTFHRASDNDINDVTSATTTSVYVE